MITDKQIVEASQVVEACQILIKLCLQEKQDTLEIEYDLNDKSHVKCKFTVDFKRV